MKNIAATWGELIALHLEIEKVKVMDKAKILIQTNWVDNIKEVISLEGNGKKEIYCKCSRNAAKIDYNGGSIGGGN